MSDTKKGRNIEKVINKRKLINIKFNALLDWIFTKKFLCYKIIINYLLSDSQIEYDMLFVAQIKIFLLIALVLGW